jgi:hypothetical protein
MELPNQESEYVFFTIGLVLGMTLVSIASFVYIIPSLSKENQAVTLANGAGALGTLALALATVYNVIQANRNIEIREKERTKPLVIDELSNVIQPAINAMVSNLENLKKSEYSGCAFEWAYVDAPKLYGGSRGPQAVQIPDSLARNRLKSENYALYRLLKSHDDNVVKIGKQASNLHDELAPKAENLLKEEGIAELDQSLRVVTNAVLHELDEFGERSALRDFWEKHREELIRFANEDTATTLDEIKANEKAYQELLEQALESLKRRKANLKDDYRISEEEINVTEDPWTDW